MKHVNIPIFIPHLGCPNDCVFCNQRTISGVTDFDPSSVRTQIDEVLSTATDAECEIAFFGGSFTGIDRSLMISLLKTANDYLSKGLICGIRCSTRPDYISEEIIDILLEYGVTTVELGIQSASDRVLCCSRRGHTVADTVNACRLITESGIELVGQMMIGLPGSAVEDELATADFIIRAGASSARIYPTVVFWDTELCNMARRGEYLPLSLDEAIERSASVYERFLESSVKVIRVGLCATDGLTDPSTCYGGPNHAALGELVENEIYYRRIARTLSSFEQTEGKSITVRVPIGDLSKAVGQKKRNKLRLIEKFGLADIKFIEDDSITAFGNLSVQERKNAGCT